MKRWFKAVNFQNNTFLVNGHKSISGGDLHLFIDLTAGQVVPPSSILSDTGLPFHSILIIQSTRRRQMRYIFGDQIHHHLLHDSSWLDLYIADPRNYQIIFPWYHSSSCERVMIYFYLSYK